jgi:hypothetical protein
MTPSPGDWMDGRTDGSIDGWTPDLSSAEPPFAFARSEVLKWLMQCWLLRLLGAEACLGCLGLDDHSH